MTETLTPELDEALEAEARALKKDLELEGKSLVEQLDDALMLVAKANSRVRVQDLKIGRLEKEIRDAHAVEPEHDQVLEVLDHWDNVVTQAGLWSGKLAYGPGTPRWKAVRARLREKHESGREPYTVEELKLVPVGALWSDWHRANRDRMDADRLYRNSTEVDRHIARAIAHTHGADALSMWFRLPGDARERWTEITQREDFVDFIRKVEQAERRRENERPTPTPAPHPELQEQYVRDLRQHKGLIHRLFELKGWPEETVLDPAFGLGYDRAAGRITIPVYADGDILTGWRRYKPGGGKWKMLGDKGVSAELWPQPEALPNAEQLWLVEGEPDVLSAHALGRWPAVGIPGAQSWKREWAERVGAYKRINLCFDCDEPGRTAAIKAANDLRSRGVDVQVIDLAPGRQDGYDLGDLLLERHAAETAPAAE